MSCPHIDELPLPPRSKQGWPWTKGSPHLSDRGPDGTEWPRITIVTPSYNQGEFIEETIRSVLLQGYPNLEYIVIDGGSDDKTFDILQKYDPWIDYWVSEPDQGQTDAIQKGLDRVSGSIWNWINSDDVLSDGALNEISKAWISNPTETLYGGNLRAFKDDYTVRINDKLFSGLDDVICIWEDYPTPQPAIFMSVEACRRAGGLDPSLRYAMDYELYLRLCQLPDFSSLSIDQVLTNFRLHNKSKSVSERIDFQEEIFRVFDRFCKKNSEVITADNIKSRRRAEYHFRMKKIREEHGGDLPLKEFAKLSARHISVIYNYRFFWSILIRRIFM